MSRYVRNGDLTVEYIIALMFKVGANSVYTDIREGYHKAIVVEWKNGEVHSFCMEDSFVNGTNMNFNTNLVSMRRCVLNQKEWMKPTIFTSTKGE